MYLVEQNNALATPFPAPHSTDKHNYQTRSATSNLLGTTLVRTNEYGKESVSINVTETGITSKRSSHKYRKMTCLISKTKEF